MDYTEKVSNLNSDVIEKMKTAIELGRWGNGDKLTPQQTESAMQAVMLWEAKHKGNDDAEPFVVGASGELYTGKGESHKTPQPQLIDDASIIIKSKV